MGDEHEGEFMLPPQVFEQRDEVHDCGEEELATLDFLQQCGVTIIMVGDLDQSIFEFRRAS